MSKFLEVQSAVMYVGAHWPLFFSALLFNTLYELLVGGVKDDEKEENVVEGEEAWVQITAFFELEPKA